MPKIFKLSEQKFTSRGAELPEFDMLSSERLSQIAGAQRIVFDFRSLGPDKFSFPYHFHHNAEELFYIISGRCSLRTPNGITEVEAGDLIHFECGAEGGHQMYNHTNETCTYLDIRTFSGADIAEYPDSNKLAVAAPLVRIFEQSSATKYLKGEDKVREIWNNMQRTQKVE